MDLRVTKQTTVAESRTEAELITCSLLSRELEWVRSFLSELGRKVNLTIPLMVDNISTIKLVENNQIHSKIRHIDIKLLAIRERQEKGVEISRCRAGVHCLF